MKKIVVISSNEIIDKPVTVELEKSGYKVTELIKNNLNTEKYTAKSDTALVSCDLRDKESLKAVLSGQDELYLNLSNNTTSNESDFQPEKDGLLNIIEAAKEKSVKRISYLSSLIARHDDEWWFVKMKQEAVNLIKNSGLFYTIFYASHFMDTIFQYRLGNNLMIIGDSYYPKYWVAAGDYGKQVARSFEINEGNMEYIIQGLECWSVEEAFEIFVNNYKAEELKIKKMPLGLLKYIGTFYKEIDYEAKLAECVNNFSEKFEGGESWEKLGKPGITIEKFAGQYKLTNSMNHNFLIN